MENLTRGATGTSIALLGSGLLPPVVRRDLADLNAQYLDLGLSCASEGDPRFGWSPAVRSCLSATDATTRQRMASAPFALFELTLPGIPGAGPLSRVADGAATVPAEGGQGRYHTLALQCAFIAWRLVTSAPYAARVALGLSATDEARLGELSPSQLAEVATAPGFLRARWARHHRFWEMLAGAAHRDSARALQWSYCVGLCLFGVDGPVAASRPAPSAARRRPRR